MDFSFDIGKPGIVSDLITKSILHIESPTMFKKVLFCTDFSENSHYAFTYALNIAKNYSAKLAILHVAHAMVHPDELSTYLPSEKLDELRIVRKKDLDQQLETHYLEKVEDFRDSHVVIKDGQPFL